MTRAPSTAGPGLGARLARNSLHSASGRVVAMLSWVLLTPALVSALRPEGFALWSLFYALAGWLGSMDLGLSQIALRFGASARARDAHDEAGEYASLAALGYVLLGLVWWAVVVLAREPVLDLLRIEGPARAAATQVFVAGAAVFVLSGLTNTATAVLQAHDRFDLANGVMLTASLAQVSGIGVAFWLRGPRFEAELYDFPDERMLQRCVLAMVAGWAVALLVGLFMLARGVPQFRWAAPVRALGRMRESLRFGLPLQAANALGVAHQQLGKLLIVRMVALAAVVPYELGLRVTTASITFAQLVLVAMIPEASMMHARAETERLLALHRRAGRFVTAAAAVVTAGLVAGAPPLFEAWLGHPDAQAALALRGLAVAAYAGVVGGVSGAIARGIGRTGIELEWSGLALVLHAVGGALLVPRLGLAGALAAIVVANVVSALWFAYRLARSQRWPVAALLWEPFALPVLAMAVGAAAGMAITAHVSGAWFALAATGAVAAAATLAVLLAVRHIEWRELVSLAQRGSAR